MIFIALLIVAVAVIVLRQFGVIEKPLTIFLIAALVIGSIAFIFSNRLHCPFAKRCPFHFCPLNKERVE